MHYPSRLSLSSTIVYLLKGSRSSHSYEHSLIICNSQLRWRDSGTRHCPSQVACLEVQSDIQGIWCHGLGRRRSCDRDPDSQGCLGHRIGACTRLPDQRRRLCSIQGAFRHYQGGLQRPPIPEWERHHRHCSGDEYRKHWYVLSFADRFALNPVQILDIIGSFRVAFSATTTRTRRPPERAACTLSMNVRTCMRSSHPHMLIFVHSDERGCAA